MQKMDEMKDSYSESMKIEFQAVEGFEDRRVEFTRLATVVISHSILLEICCKIFDDCQNQLQIRT